MRDLAMFNLAIDSKLRGCDVVALKVEDIAPHGYVVDRATVRQKKTGQPVRFEVTEQTRQAVDDYIRATGKNPGQFLFGSRRGLGRCVTTRQYARLVAEWVGSVGLDPGLFNTPNQSYVDLSTNRQPTCRSAVAWPYQDREHSSLLGHRS